MDLCVCLCVVQLLYQHMQLVLESCSIWSVVTHKIYPWGSFFFFFTSWNYAQVSVARVQAFNIHLISIQKGAAWFQLHTYIYISWDKFLNDFKLKRKTIKIMKSHIAFKKIYKLDFILNMATVITCIRSLQGQLPFYPLNVEGRNADQKLVYTSTS